MVADWIAATGTKRKRAISQVGCATFHWNKTEGHEKLMRDYFLSGCTMDVPSTSDDMEANEPFFQER